MMDTIKFEEMISLASFVLKFRGTNAAIDFLRGLKDGILKHAQDQANIIEQHIQEIRCGQKNLDQT